MQKARELSAHHRLPIVAVHHMEAHALMARAAAARCSSGSESEDARPEFPFLALLVSGGHNLLLVVRGVGDYQILGSTVDDAVGASSLPWQRSTCLVLQRVEQSSRWSITDFMHEQTRCCSVAKGAIAHRATGEAFDKSARLLGLDASGAALEQLATAGDPAAIPFAVSS